ncbi:Cof-type HAD-IIB family hydrolase [Pantoea coffeiphila]|nr:Cof-type HAD-IIB family hydrolase [Pantoea coffeiphila]
MIKLVAVDMDGTFLNSQGDYARQRFAEQYQQLKERDIKFVVASGNQYYQLKSFFPDIDAELAYVAENGAYIVDKQREIYCGSLPEAEVKRVIEVISRIEGVNFLVCGRKWAWMLASAGEAFFNEMRVYYHMLEKIDSYDQIDDTVFKFALSYVEDDVSALMARIAEEVGDIVTPVSSGHGSVDLIIPGNHKANGIRRIQQIYGVADNEVLAFGDGGNDLEMLRHAGFGFAMANGSPAAKAAARYAAPTNDEQGVLAVIDDMLLGYAPFNA